MMREGQHADHNTPPKCLSTVATSLDKISRMTFILQSRSTKFKLKVINMCHTLNIRVSQHRSCNQVTQGSTRVCRPQPATATRTQLAQHQENHKGYASSFSSSTADVQEGRGREGERSVNQWVSKKIRHKNFIDGQIVQITS